MALIPFWTCDSVQSGEQGLNQTGLERWQKPLSSRLLCLPVVCMEDATTLWGVVKLWKAWYNLETEINLHLLKCVGYSAQPQPLLSVTKATGISAALMLGTVCFSYVPCGCIMSYVELVKNVSIRVFIYFNVNTIQSRGTLWEIYFRAKPVQYRPVRK